jgi:hypothetical protein
MTTSISHPLGFAGGCPFMGDGFAREFPRTLAGKEVMRYRNDHDKPLICTIGAVFSHVVPIRFFDPKKEER